MSYVNEFQQALERFSQEFSRDTNRLLNVQRQVDKLIEERAVEKEKLEEAKAKTKVVEAKIAAEQEKADQTIKNLKALAEEEVRKSHELYELAKKANGKAQSELTQAQDEHQKALAERELYERRNKAITEAVKV